MANSERHEGNRSPKQSGYMDFDGLHRQITQRVRVDWKTKELFDLFERFEDDLESAAKGILDTERYKMIILRLAATSLIRMREIIILCEAGFSDGAFALARQLYEQMIYMLFFFVHEREPNFHEYLDDYDLNAECQLFKYNSEMANLSSDPDNNELQSEYENIKSRAHHNLPNGCKNDYWWAGKNRFSEIVRDVEQSFGEKNDQRTLKELHLFYTATNRTLHANAAGNKQRLGRTYNSNVIDTAPTVTGQGFPLHFASLCMTVVMIRVCQIVGIDTVYYKRIMNDMAKYFSEKTNVVIQGNT